MVTLIIMLSFIYSRYSGNCDSAKIHDSRESKIVYIWSYPPSVKSTINHSYKQESTVHIDNCWLHGFRRQKLSTLVPVLFRCNMMRNLLDDDTFQALKYMPNLHYYESTVRVSLLA